MKASATIGQFFEKFSADIAMAVNKSYGAQGNIDVFCLFTTAY